MRVVSRIVRMIWGGDIDRALRPVLAVSLVGSVAGSSAFTYLGIWAIKSLHAGQARLGLAYLGGAALSMVLGYAGGHWSDRIGRRPLILLGWGFEAILPLGLIAIGHRVTLGLVLLAVLPALASLGGAADQAMIADLVPPERHETAYASVRVASNLGVAIGPPIGGVLLIGDHWTHLWLGSFVLGTVGFAIAWRFIPRGGAYAPEEPPTRGSFGVIVRDSPFLLFILFGMGAQMTYMATETLLPISVTTTHHLAPAAWGFLMILNPVSVTLFQLRLTRLTSSIPASLKLAAAMLMMGAPFVLLNFDASIPAVALVIAVFVVGEMLWVPSSQAVIAALAPADIRGAYMGVFNATGSVGWALTPFLGLQVRHAYGDAVMWWCVAAVGVSAGVLGFAAARGHDADAAVASAA